MNLNFFVIVGEPRMLNRDLLERQRDLLDYRSGRPRGRRIVRYRRAHSVASPGLYTILQKSGVEFRTARYAVCLADGTSQVRDVLICDTFVKIAKRNIPTTFLVIMRAENRNLLGRDFIMRANIILEIPQGTWYFADLPEQKFCFVEDNLRSPASPPPADDAELMHVDAASRSLRTDSSGYCLGAVLMQGEGPDERPIEYASRLL
ncbi:hypothetical protein ABMA28_010668 [Loxostege sticticalis]|uniref:Reverse transcriptase RNase H-like domain-containing protein n=1 Tax=Loxostege sticticalis TaxID=481309 RepID=A0ABD0SB44_LOXSC